MLVTDPPHALFAILAHQEVGEFLPFTLKKIQSNPIAQKSALC
jgi:hypothetical protein